MYTNGFTLVKTSHSGKKDLLSSAESLKASKIRSVRRSHMTAAIDPTELGGLRQRRSTAYLAPEPAMKRRTSEYTPSVSNPLCRRESRESEIYYVGPPQPEGSLRLMPHDDIANRYQVIKVLGEGTFSQVLAAIDHKTKSRVAVKVLKDMDTTYSHSLREIEILEGLKRAFGASNLSVELLDSFVCRGHKIMILPMYHSTLRSAVRSLTVQSATSILYQLLRSLAQIHAKNIIHCDLKPDNIMFTSPLQDVVKIIDFGSACSGKELLFHYVQSRFYRAPEVILGCKYTTAIDMWSLGCIAVELIANHPPFIGDNENQQLISIVEARGYPPAELLRMAARGKEFFSSCNKLKNPEPSTEVRTLSLNQLTAVSPEFHDFVLRCFEWLPSRRLTAERALAHPFFKSVHAPPKKQTKKK